VLLCAQRPPDQPTFRSGVQQIEVDVLVTDQKGNAVGGLTREDFTLLEDGIPQRISGFSFSEFPVEVPADRAAAAKAVESDVATNVAHGRMYVILLNGRGKKSQLIAQRFVEEAVGPNDQVAVVHVLGNMSAGQGFTKSRALMLAAIDRIDQDDPDSHSTFHGDQFTVSYEVAEEVFKRLGLINGRRKAVIWVDPPPVFIDQSKWAAQRMFAQRDALRAATRNNVAIYPLSTSGMNTLLGRGVLEGQAGLRVLSDDTGGYTIVGTNNFTPEFQKLAVDNSTYYLLGYEPLVEHQDGKFHTLTVRVNRPGLTVRARRGYYAPEPAAATKPDSAVAEGLSRDTAKALHLPSSSGELGIDLTATPFKGSGRVGSVVIGAQLRSSDLALGAGERLEIAYQAMNAEGTITPGAFKVFTLDFTRESRTHVEQNGIRVIDRLELPRGRHQVRFAVHQPNGKTGSVVADVEIPDYSAQLVMSGVVVGSQETGPRTLLGDPRMTAALSADPTTNRRFVNSDVITAYVEVYTDPPSPLETLRVAATVTPAKRGLTQTPHVSTVFQEPGRSGHVTRIPLRDLTAGDYVLTLEAGINRRVTKRQVPFSVLTN
jgi:VWFA-related protein